MQIEAQNDLQQFNLYSRKEEGNIFANASTHVSCPQRKSGWPPFVRLRGGGLPQNQQVPFSVQEQSRLNFQNQSNQNPGSLVIRPVYQNNTAQIMSSNGSDNMQYFNRPNMVYTKSDGSSSGGEYSGNEMYGQQRGNNNALLKQLLSSNNNSNNGGGSSSGSGGASNTVTSAPQMNVASTPPNAASLRVIPPQTSSDNTDPQRRMPPNPGSTGGPTGGGNYTPNLPTEPVPHSSLVGVNRNSNNPSNSVEQQHQQVSNSSNKPNNPIMQPQYGKQPGTTNVHPSFPPQHPQQAIILERRGGGPQPMFFHTGQPATSGVIHRKPHPDSPATHPQMQVMQTGPRMPTQQHREPPPGAYIVSGGQPGVQGAGVMRSPSPSPYVGQQQPAPNGPSFRWPTAQSPQHNRMTDFTPTVGYIQQGPPQSRMFGPIRPSPPHHHGGGIQQQQLTDQVAFGGPNCMTPTRLVQRQGPTAVMMSNSPGDVNKCQTPPRSSPSLSNIPLSVNIPQQPQQGQRYIDPSNGSSPLLNSPQSGSGPMVISPRYPHTPMANNNNSVGEQSSPQPSTVNVPPPKGPGGNNKRRASQNSQTGGRGGGYGSGGGQKRRQSGSQQQSPGATSSGHSSPYLGSAAGVITNMRSQSPATATEESQPPVTVGHIGPPKVKRPRKGSSQQGQGSAHSRGGGGGVNSQSEFGDGERGAGSGPSPPVSTNSANKHFLNGNDSNGSNSGSGGVQPSSNNNSDYARDMNIHQQLKKLPPLHGLEPDIMKCKGVGGLFHYWPSSTALRFSSFASDHMSRSCTKEQLEDLEMDLNYYEYAPFGPLHPPPSRKHNATDVGKTSQQQQNRPSIRRYYNFEFDDSSRKGSKELNSSGGESDDIVCSSSPECSENGDNPDDMFFDIEDEFEDEKGTYETKKNIFPEVISKNLHSCKRCEKILKENETVLRLTKRFKFVEDVFDSDLNECGGDAVYFCSDKCYIQHAFLLYGDKYFKDANISEAAKLKFIPKHIVSSLDALAKFQFKHESNLRKQKAFQVEEQLENEAKRKKKDEIENKLTNELKDKKKPNVYKRWTRLMVDKRKYRKLNDHELTQLMFSLGLTMMPSPSMQDTRKCLLCGTVGDRPADGPGRLLNFDIEQWIHLNCALWSEEVYETVSGALVNVSEALKSGGAIDCDFCGKTGATLKCWKNRCSKIYHVACAMQDKAMFYKNKSMYCHQHVLPKSEKDQELNTLAVFRRVFIEKDDDKQIADVVSLGMETAHLRIGSLILVSLGQLLPQQLPNFHTKDYIFPIGYKVIRYFWSRIDLNKRSQYICSIEEEIVSSECKPEVMVRVDTTTTSTTATVDSKLPEVIESEVRAEVKKEGNDEEEEICKSRPVFVVTSDSGTPNEIVYKDSTPHAVWIKVITQVAKVRSASDVVKIYTDYVSGEEMFGLTDPNIVRILESLPGVDALKNYNFKFGKNSLLELPLAINPTGCARSEPKLRTHVKRVHAFQKVGMDHHSRTQTNGRNSRAAKDNVLSLAQLEMFGGSSSSVYGKTFTQSKVTQYRKLVCEWRQNVVLARSKIQGLGLYASRDLDPDQMVIEYIGEVIRSDLTDIREKRYESQNRGIYMFRLDDDLVLDATVCGGMARYINHCCQPNCFTEVVENGNSLHIVIIANRLIKRGEELSYDYKFDFESDENKIPCMCGAPNCRKWMN